MTESPENYPASASETADFAQELSNFGQRIELLLEQKEEQNGIKINKVIEVPMPDSSSLFLGLKNTFSDLENPNYPVYKIWQQKPVSSGGVRQDKEVCRYVWDKYLPGHRRHHKRRILDEESGQLRIKNDGFEQEDIDQIHQLLTMAEAAGDT